MNPKLLMLGGDASKAHNITPVSTGRTLVLDGDSVCYELSAKYKTLETMQRHYETRVREYMFLAKSDSARVHLTPKGCLKNGRHLLLGAKPYQGNRTNKPKPPLLEVLRDSLVRYFEEIPDIDVFAHYDIEADDACMIDVYQIRNTCLISPDKDLQIAPTPSFCLNTYRELTLESGNRFGKLWWGETESGNAKIRGKGTAFFWWQMLAGDTADNVKGILKYNGKLCGEKTAMEILYGETIESEVANLVISGYKQINQNPLPEASALWLLRSREDTAEGYITSLNLTPANEDFILDCYEREWKRAEDMEEGYDDN